MSEFLLLLRGGDEQLSTMSPEEMQKHMEEWGTWIEQLNQEGCFIGGNPLAKDPAKVININTVMDGPYMESKEAVGGYVFIKAESIEKAVEIGKGCPVLNVNGNIEVREVSPMSAES